MRNVDEMMEIEKKRMKEMNEEKNEVRGEKRGRVEIIKGWEKKVINKGINEEKMRIINSLEIEVEKKKGEGWCG